MSQHFFIGAVVAKRFAGKWFRGKVDGVSQDENQVLWHVTYSDFDGEDLTKQELAKCLTYHPALQGNQQMSGPAIGSFVWYSEDQQPRLGQVVAVDRTSPRPITVQIFQPQANAVSLPRARFRLARETESGEAKATNITRHQIMLQFRNLTARVYLSASDKRKLQNSLQ